MANLKNQLGEFISDIWTLFYRQTVAPVYPKVFEEALALIETTRADIQKQSETPREEELAAIRSALQQKEAETGKRFGFREVFDQRVLPHEESSFSKLGCLWEMQSFMTAAQQKVVEEKKEEVQKNWSARGKIVSDLWREVAEKDYSEEGVIKEEIDRQTADVLRWNALDDAQRREFCRELIAELRKPDQSLWDLERAVSDWPRCDSWHSFSGVIDAHRNEISWRQRETLHKWQSERVIQRDGMKPQQSELMRDILETEMSAFPKTMEQLKAQKEDVQRSDTLTEEQKVAKCREELDLAKKENPDVVFYKDPTPLIIPYCEKVIGYDRKDMTFSQCLTCDKERTEVWALLMKKDSQTIEIKSQLLQAEYFTGRYTQLDIPAGDSPTHTSAFLEAMSAIGLDNIREFKTKFAMASTEEIRAHLVLWRDALDKSYLAKEYFKGNKPFGPADILLTVLDEDTMGRHKTDTKTGKRDIEINVVSLAKLQKTEDGYFDLLDTFFHEYRHDYQTVLRLNSISAEGKSWSEQNTEIAKMTLLTDVESNPFLLRRFDGGLKSLKSYLYLLDPKERDARQAGAVGDIALSVCLGATHRVAGFLKGLPSELLQQLYNVVEPLAKESEGPSPQGA